MIRHEHKLAEALVAFVNEAVTAPKLFLAFDRAAPHGPRTHLYEKRRGIARGTPDTLLMVKGFPDLWCELKRTGEKVSAGDDQDTMGHDMVALGRWWFWTTTVEGYRARLANLGIPLAVNAAYLAMQLDAQVDSAVARQRLRAGKAPKSYAKRPRPPRVSPARIRRIERARYGQP